MFGWMLGRKINFIKITLQKSPEPRGQFLYEKVSPPTHTILQVRAFTPFLCLVLNLPVVGAQLLPAL